MKEAIIIIKVLRVIDAELLFSWNYFSFPLNKDIILSGEMLS